MRPGIPGSACICRWALHRHEVPTQSISSACGPGPQWSGTRLTCSWVMPWQPSWVPCRYRVGWVMSAPQATACSAAHSSEAESTTRGSADQRHQHTVTGRVSVGPSHFPPGYSALTCQVPTVALAKMSSKQPFWSVVTVW
jgi:hypothetical protein